MKTLKKAAILGALWLAMSLSPSKINKFQTPGQENKKAEYFLLYYTPGDLKYKEEITYIPLHLVKSKIVKKGDTIAGWWLGEGKSYNDLYLGKLEFLVINDPKYYPKGCIRDIDLRNYEIELVAGESANFVDYDISDTILGEKAETVPSKKMKRITAEKDNKGELYEQYRKR